MSCQNKSAICTADNLFESVIDFEKILEDGKLHVRTLGGTTLTLQVTAGTTISEVKQQISDMVLAPLFTLKLVSGDKILDKDAQTLSDVGLAVPGASLVLVRCAAHRAEWVRLFNELVRAIQTGSSEKARMLVDKGAGFDESGNILKAGNRMTRPDDVTVHVDEPGNTMLHLAIRAGLTDLALYLASTGVDINTTNDSFRTPLVQAVLKKQDSLAEVLLEKKADVNKRDLMGNSALCYALRQNNDGLAAQLIFACTFNDDLWHDFAGMAPGRCSSTAGVVLNAASTYLVQAEDFKHICFPVLQCCASKMPLSVLALLNKNAPVSGTDARNRTALHYAYGNQMQEVVSALLVQGADPAAQDDYGWLPHQGISDSPAFA